MRADTIERRSIELSGLIQGVGFRPFVYRAARGCELTGWVANDTRGVCIEVQGRSDNIELFVNKLRLEKPQQARIDHLVQKSLPVRQESGFVIRDSEHGATPSAIVLPDLAPCDECLHELFDPGDRRYGYPFINCTHCGPRYSIVERLPYDRSNTALKDFPLCENCRREYREPQDRRFHAEPNACPECGPQLQVCDRTGSILGERDSALQLAIEAIETGKIVALKGVGGFQLLVDASNTEAVRRLRARKRRPHKPFALLYPDIDSVHRDCDISPQEETLLCGQERPIVLLRADPAARKWLAPEVAPGNPNLGIMLPASPLHCLLMALLQRPLVATSGNLAGEPICIRNDEAVTQLGGVADLFLTHNRPILRALDDSVFRLIDGCPVMLRRARGYAPLPFYLPDTEEPATDCIALGGDLKCCAALSRGNTVYLTQHIGDLESPRAMSAFESATDALAAFYGLQPRLLLHDLHPGYRSSRWAKGRALPSAGVQHHLAHFFSGMAEHSYQGPALGICWDGTGYGDDGTLRGSEFLRWHPGAAVFRFASLRTFPLPGGEQAVREPSRSALGLRFEGIGKGVLEQSELQNCFKRSEMQILLRMLERNLYSPRCSSVGRLFDAVAALLGLVTKISFEGQAAMALEFAAWESERKDGYPFELQQTDGSWVIDWAPAINALLEEGQAGVSTTDRAAAFHNTLARVILAVAKKAGEEHVFLSGGVFQNRRLTESAVKLLRENGFRTYCHCRIPPNDGGIALGQIYYARCMAASGVQIGKGSALCV